MFDNDFQQEQLPVNSTSAINLQTIRHALRERWWVIATCVLVTGGVALIYALIARPVYASTVVLKYVAEAPKILAIEKVVDGDARSKDVRDENMKEVREVIKSPPLLAQVIERNNLAAAPWLLGTRALPARLLSLLNVELRPGTAFIDVRVEHANPEAAARLANAVAQEFIREDSESYKATSQLATTFLAEESQQLQCKLVECETKLQGYRDQSLPVEQRQEVAIEGLKALNQKVSEAKVERIRLESEYVPALNAATNVQQLLTIPRVAADPIVTTLRASLVEQEVGFATVRQVYKENHPAHLEALGKLTETRQALSSAALKAVATMRMAFDNCMEREQTLKRELELAVQAARLHDPQAIQHAMLMRERDQYRALYDALIKRMVETRIAGSFEMQRVQVFRKAEPAKLPVRPQRLLIVILGFTGGLFGGALLVIGLTLFDDSVKTLNEAEQFLRFPVLSTVPHIKALIEGGGQIVMNDRLPTSGAESFRSLRASLLLSDREEKHRSFLFTSTLPKEGKTFCSLNFAVSLARQGLRTLLVDCDLRRPMLTEIMLGKKAKAPGLTDVLNGEPAAISETATKNLFFCAAGSQVGDVSELLSQRQLKTFLETALLRFDRVVIDSAPIAGISDTLLLVHDVHAVCLVVRAGRTSRGAVIRSIQMLRTAGAPLVGTILNAVPRSRMAAYGDPYYDYGYGYSRHGGNGNGSDN
jgi:polysaccharide biosynthesis transport protein